MKRGQTLAALLLAANMASAQDVGAHNFQVQDGLQYGYKAAISETARASGQVAPQILMFRFAGERDGKFQVHTVEGNAVTALECTKPCKVVKTIAFIDANYLRQSTQVSHMAYEPGTIAYAVFEDALNGRLRPYGMERGNKRYQVWVEEKRGFREYPVPPAKKS